jgi:hypothetical protein
VRTVAYVLAFSLILLNTDAHNPNVKRKMTFDDFVRMNRGIDQGRDLPEGLLQKLFTNIQRQEIAAESEAGVVTYFNAAQEGYLFKLANGVKHWSKRYFLLNTNCLYYFADKAVSGAYGVSPSIKPASVTETLLVCALSTERGFGAPKVHHSLGKRQGVEPGHQHGRVGVRGGERRVPVREAHS